MSGVTNPLVVSMPKATPRKLGADASLAACQKAAIAPAPVAVSVRIACELARALDHLHVEIGPHGELSPHSVLVGYDGVVTLLDPGASARSTLEATTPSETEHARNAYLSPEQVSGRDVDARADVFTLGVVLWELLTGTLLFKRESVDATLLAIVDDPILDVRAVNPDVPPRIAEFLLATLAREPSARFDSAGDFERALAGASAVSGVHEASAEEVGAWVNERVPRAAAVREFAAGARTSHAPSLPVGPAVPELDMPSAILPRALRTSSTSMRAAAAAAVAAAKTPIEATPLGPPAADGVRHKAISFHLTDDDDDLEIERSNIEPQMAISSRSPPAEIPSRMPGASPRSRSSASMPAARPSGSMPATRPVGGATSRAPGANDAAQTPGNRRRGAELALAHSRIPPSSASAVAAESGARTPALAFVVTAVIALGSAGALARFVHRAGGRDITHLVPHAFDGSSAQASGMVSLVALVCAVVIGFVGLRLKPYAWGLVASGGALLLLAIAMATVTLASTGENPTPPDGVLLVPILLPAALFLLGLGLCRRAALVFARGAGLRRLGAIPIGILAGALVFAAFESSHLF